jgi:putative effector of murein hydrolase LrgA (UPF0299 family)
MLEYFLLLLVCQFAGELVRALTGLPLSGAVIGMALLFVTLVLAKEAPPGLQQVSTTLLQHLSLLFVPAAVGVMLHLPLIGEEWFAITTALVGSTVLTVVVTAGAMRFLCRRSEMHPKTPVALGSEAPSMCAQPIRREIAQ